MRQHIRSVSQPAYNQHIRKGFRQLLHKPFGQFLPVVGDIPRSDNTDNPCDIQIRLPLIIKENRRIRTFPQTGGIALVREKINANLVFGNKLRLFLRPLEHFGISDLGNQRTADARHFLQQPLFLCKHSLRLSKSLQQVTGKNISHSVYHSQGYLVNHFVCHSGKWLERCCMLR
ncbi:hypothetical protein Barb4_02056 [Bacteroidales bacterium Barb4]|nr:hypothetical protein Barb4_02056 [Bacteroidales bacterium Barb4]